VSAHAAKSRGYALSYEDVGSGPVIVLVNGLGGPASEWRDAGYVDALSARYRLLIADPLGHGESDKPHDVDAYRPQDVGRDLIAVMDAAGVERATLWGYSRGGNLAATAVAEHPERAASLIVGGSALRPPRSGVDAIRPTTKALLDGDWAGFWAALPLAVPEAYRHYYEGANDPKAIGAASLATERSHYVIDLNAISAPTLLYCGAQDVSDELDATGQELGAGPHVLTGDHDHFAAFDDADAVLAIVAPHLAETTV
jgi:pimeloyl-ACP methyl ester carboxylesterase